ncbi:transporter substrate-binding domain-containing protein [Pantoea tagorei]
MTQRAPIRRFCLTTLFATLLLTGAAAQAKEWKSITIATEGSYEPWNLTLPGGKLGGFEPELMEDLCKRMGTQCKLVVQNWDGMIAGLNAGKYDVIMDAIVITPDRKKSGQLHHALRLNARHLYYQQREPAAAGRQQHY